MGVEASKPEDEDIKAKLRSIRAMDDTVRYHPLHLTPHYYTMQHYHYTILYYDYNCYHYTTNTILCYAVLYYDYSTLYYDYYDDTVL